MGASQLPAPLPEGFSYQLGVNVEILTNGEVLENLPDGAGIELDYPVNTTLIDQFAVLYWNDPDGDGQGEWVEITQPLDRSQLLQTLNIEAEDELYKLSTFIGDQFYPVLTTDRTGIFILARR